MEQNAQVLLNKAIELHVGGELTGAEQIYHEIVRTERSCFPALANLGIIYFSQGQWNKAEQYLKHALELEDSNAELNYKYAVSLHKQGSFSSAIHAYEKAISLQPNYPEAYSNLGVIMKAENKLEEAINYYQKALQFNPNFPAACSNLGHVLEKLGKFEDAIEYYKRAIELDPHFAEAYSNLGNALHFSNKIEDSIYAYKQAILIKPDFGEVYFKLGISYYQLGNMDDAIKAYREAIKLRPLYPEAYSNLGVVYKDLQLLEQSIASYQQAIDQNPDLPEVYYNMALAVFEQGKYSEAIEYHKKAIQLNPNYADAHLSLSFALLHMGNYTLGWREYEWRFYFQPLAFELPEMLLWNGEIKAELELIIIEEQGIGDILQFVRYAKILKKLFKKVSILTRESLCELLQLANLFDQIFPLGSQITFNVNARWIPIMSLPNLLEISRDNTLTTECYFKVPDSIEQKWKQKLDKSLLVVGLNWQGNPKCEKHDFKGRSFPLSMYEPLASIPGVEFVSLQKGYGSEQLESCVFRDRFVSCQEEINQTWDWVETAGIVQNCDLIITSDTSIAHLAGALGKPVWILLKKLPDWRWGLEGETTPWYPSARLFRQAESGNWTQVIDQVKEALSKLISSSV